MLIRNQVSEITDNQPLLQFCDFVLAETKNGELPDYEKMDLMEIPSLVPNIFVHDYREGIEDGLLIKFSGTKLDENYGQVVQGRYLQDTYTGDDGEDKYLPLHYEAISRKKPFYANRTVHYNSASYGEKFRMSEALFFPCSSDQVSVNYAMGIVFFEFVSEFIYPKYIILGT
jgi:hypothetical protein